MPIGWKVIEPPVEATIQAKTKKLGFSAQGQQPAMGPMYALLKKRAASFNGRVDPAGGIATTTKKTRMSAIGSQTQLGGMSVSVKKTSFQGSVLNTGQMATSVKKTIAAVNGRQTFQGALGTSLKKAIANLQGAHTQAGTIATGVKKRVFTGTGSTPLIVTNTLSGNSFDTNFWGQNWNSGVYLSSGKVYPNTVGGYYGWGKYYSGITCKTQFSANGAFVSAKASTAAIDDRGTLLCVGIDSPTAMTKVISLAVRPSQGANTVEINKGTGVGLLANANAPATPAANDIWWFGWKKVGSDYVYTGYQNGAVAITWTDTGGATFGVPGRYVGIGSCLVQSNFQNFQDQNGWIGTVTCGDNP